MATVNIGRDEADKAYRYKMPVLQCKVMGRGNGVKTAIVNVDDICKSLKTQPQYVTKYIGRELGAQSVYVKTGGKRPGTAVFNGAHDSQKLCKLLDSFIREFILCRKCGLPETSWTVDSKRIKVYCSACGYNGSLQSDHKLVDNILKNAPKDEDQKDIVEKNIVHNLPETDVVWYSDTSKEAVELRRKEMLENK